MATGNIIVVEPTDDYKRIHKSIIRNKDIDCLTLGIYTKIVVLGAEWQLNIKGLSKALGLSDSKIRKSIGILEKEGYIVREPIRASNGQMQGWNYYVYPTPIDKSDRSNAGYPKIQFDEQPIAAESETANRLPKKPTTRLTDNTENGEDSNIILNENIDLINNNKTNKEEKEYKEKFVEFVKLYKKLTQRKTRGIETEFNEFKSRHKDWRKVIPYLSIAIERESKERQNAQASHKFFPEPQMLRTYLGKQRSWERYVDIDEDLQEIENEYNPITSMSLSWDNNYKCFLYIGFYMDGDRIFDGYDDDKRPDGAKIVLNNGRGTLVWNSKTRKWDKQL